jgi:hypothetical protein
MKPTEIVPASVEKFPAPGGIGFPEIESWKAL